MSLSPADADDQRALDNDSEFMRNQLRLYRFLREGKSFSGHERNCCFLNQGDGTFADISAISGFDFLDDARGSAMVDWDHDGDLDCWITNRNSPRIRFLLNEAPGENDFLAIRLRGTTSNRDAVGAQVRVEFVDPDDRPLMRAVRAGEGFLAQSSKWLSFGLGTGKQIKQVVVRWPGGDEQTLTDVAPNSRYLLTQGSAPVLADRRPDFEPLASTPPASGPGDEPPRRPMGLLHRPLPMPEIPYVSREGEETTFANRRQRPVLVNLWASWCRPCLVELTEWKARHSELEAAEIDLLTLCVDGLKDVENSRENPATADLEVIGNLDRLGADGEFPGAAGAATSTTLDLLQLIHNQMFGIHQPLPLPTSLLLTADGDLAAVYKGPVSVDDLLRDLQKLSERPTASAPFAGRWLREPKFDPLFVVSKLVEQGYLDEVQAYFKRHANRLVRGVRYADVVAQLGSALIGRQQYRLAEPFYREALELNPDNAGFHNDLGGILQVRGEIEAAIEQFKQAVQLEPRNAAIRANLAAALTRHDQIREALIELRQALDDDPQNVAALVQAADLLRLNDRKSAAISHYQRAIRVAPASLPARTNLGALLLEMGQASPATEHLAAARDLAPKDAAVRKNLGLALAISGETTAAIDEFRAALEIRPNDAPAQNNLGGLLTRAGQVGEAVEHFRQAVALAPENVKYRQNLEAAKEMLAGADR